MPIQLGPPTTEDFSSDDQISAGKKTATDGPPYDPTKDRENARWKLARALLLILTLVLIAGFVGLISGKCDRDCNEQLMKMMTLIFTPIVALVGSAIGFYFGTQPARKT